jgi:hypothetical protein
MAPTLASIGFTLMGGSLVAITSIALFGVAVLKRSIFIAPRATARPRDVIYNPQATRDSPQWRGGPMLGWVPWVMGLSYDTMLNGIPGTGTRDGGLSGPMLKVTLDGIVLLRFHALCRRVAVVATFLCIGVLLPSYWSAQCFTPKDLDSTTCEVNAYNLTDYERTTLAK